MYEANGFAKNDLNFMARGHEVRALVIGGKAI
jgi:hypothetical protein